MIRRPPRSTLSSSSAASDVYKRQMFVLGGNLAGMLPYSFTITSHIIVTLALALVVFLGVTILGFYKHGLGFLKLFAPSGVPAPLYLLIIPVEVLSYFTRPISLSVRLFANMMAGHIMLKVFAGFVVSLGAAGALGVFGAIFPFAFNIFLTGCLLYTSPSPRDS
eukprot:TRINITY_DN31065_c0_g1_i1.p1 TRINITY_DN31065_c0_g1~~TRINITY_DN31065_c0_g1_i1.p1  ORF type:complete len:164 (-),score=31.06 TRINITY_DN31065_c0_g1_i1:139-630(-)